MLQTDASSLSMGGLLEQGGMFMGYASKSLNKTEQQQYSVI